MPLEDGRLAFEPAGNASRCAAPRSNSSCRRNACVFRELELPARAGEFLEGVVRSQIDRLTPWRASDCAYGWGAPKPLDAGRVTVTVAATKRDLVAPFLEVAADSVAVTSARDGEAPIAVLSRRAGASARRGRWRLSLTTALVVSLACLAAALVADWTLGASLRDETDSLTASLAQRRERVASARARPRRSRRPGA